MFSGAALVADPITAVVTSAVAKSDAYSESFDNGTTQSCAIMGTTYAQCGAFPQLIYSFAAVNYSNALGVQASAAGYVPLQFASFAESSLIETFEISGGTGTGWLAAVGGAGGRRRW
jgi:hypothetical protein